MGKQFKIWMPVHLYRHLEESAQQRKEAGEYPRTVNGMINSVISEHYYKEREEK